MAGRPKGSPNKDRPFREALRLELGGDANQRKLRKIARGLIDKAGEGDVAAIKQIADRLDGKPAQAVEMNGGLTITYEEALAQLE